MGGASDSQGLRRSGLGGGPLNSLVRANGHKSYREEVLVGDRQAE